MSIFNVVRSFSYLLGLMDGDKNQQHYQIGFGEPFLDVSIL